MSKMGRLISISGFDGVGKSTQVKLLSDYLIGQKKTVFVTEDMFTYFLLKSVIGMLRNLSGSPSGGPVKRNRRNLPKFWFAFAFIDIWIGYIFKTRFMLTRYDFIIADRFYTDIWVNLLYYGYLPNWAYNAFLELLPKSDVAILLSANPKIVLKRESEFPPAYYIEQSKIYNRLTDQIGFYIVDANQDPKVVFKEIKKVIDIDSAK